MFVTSVDYEQAVEKAPAGWRHFNIEDVARLPEAVRAHEMAHIPSGEPEHRVLRAMFWTLVYHLEPDRWDELSRFEPIHPDLMAMLPARARTGLDVGAGSGRLTEHLAERCREVAAVEPSAGLRAILSRRLPQVKTSDGWAEALPVRDGWSELTAACGTLGPEPAIVQELERVTALGGTIALISPEDPGWFAANGWRHITAPPIAPPAHPRWLDEFFGPLDPPHEMVLREKTA